MNLLNKLFVGKKAEKKGEDLKRRLNSCIKKEDRTVERIDHVNPQEYIEYLVELKANPEEYDFEAYNEEMDVYEKAMSEIKFVETTMKLKDSLMRK